MKSILLAFTVSYAPALKANGPSFNVDSLKGNTTISDTEFVALRCQDNAQTTYFLSHGKTTLNFDDRPAIHAFDIVGVDISRCIFDKESQSWKLLSRKVSLYLDPKNGKVIKNWTNPITGEALNVLHRSYDYQEFTIPKLISALSEQNTTSVSLNSSFRLQNPYANDPRLAQYSPEETIQATDAYKFFGSKRKGSYRDVHLSYFRTGTFEPWMKMGGKAGKVVLSYIGKRVDGFASLPDVLKTLISDRMPQFREAPSCLLERSSASSWTRFEGILDELEAGVEFPLPAPLTKETCLY